MDIFEATKFFKLGYTYTLADLNKARNKIEHRYRQSVLICATVKYRHHVLKRSDITREQINTAYNVCLEHLRMFGGNTNGHVIDYIKILCQNEENSLQR